MSKKIIIDQARDIVERLRKALGLSSFVELARFLEVAPPVINRAIRTAKVPDLWIYKIAVLTGHRVEWLREGTEPRKYVELLKDATAVTDQLWALQGEIERIATSPAQSLRLVHTVQDAAKLLQAVTIAEAAAQYNVDKETKAELAGLDPDGRATVHRLIQALLHGDTHIRMHLIGQLKIIEEAVVARKHKDATKKATE